MSWTYSGNPANSDTDAVRFEIQDTNSATPLLQDAEIQWAIQDENGTVAGTPATITGAALYRPAARCCEVIARSLAMQADTLVGTLQETYSKAAQTYAQRAQELRQKAAALNAPYAGGQSWSEKEGWQQNPDLVQPAFRRDQWDNPYTGSSQDDESSLPPFAF